MKYAILFPGQGAQSIGMMESFADCKAVRETFSEATDILGIDLWSLQQKGNTEELARTTNTQPLMLTVGVAVYRLWSEFNPPQPAISAGHSLGEYSALVAASTLSFAEALRLVIERANLMANCANDGEAGNEENAGIMAAILHRDVELINNCCAQATISTSQGEESVEAVNFNTPEQTVIAGHKKAVIRCKELLINHGVKRIVMLPVSGAFHSKLMRPAAEGMHTHLKNANLSPPKIPVIHNVDVQIHKEIDEIRSALANQVANPVRWVETIKKIKSMDIENMVECAPGKIISGMTRRIDKSISMYSLISPIEIENTIKQQFN